MEIDEDFIRECLAEFYRRVEAIKLVGGIAVFDVIDKGAKVPDGWVLDHSTEYYVPPGFSVSGTYH